MANIEGLFNLGAFEKASENDILNMNINESAEVDVFEEAAAWKVHLKADIKKLSDSVRELLKSVSSGTDGNLKEMKAILKKSYEVQKLGLEIADKWSRMDIDMDERSYKKLETFVDGIAKESKAFGAILAKVKNDDVESVTVGEIISVLEDDGEKLYNYAEKALDVINSLSYVQDDYDKTIRPDYNHKPGDVKNRKYDILTHSSVPKTKEIREAFEEFMDYLGSAYEEDTNISVPGGLKEDPSVNVDDFTLSVPGGDKEKPDAKPEGGEKSIPVPSKVTIDSKTYNAAIDNLTKSFKEAVNVLDSFKYVNVVEESVEDKYNNYMEEAMDNAFVEFAEGPLFESLNREDQEEIKKVIKNIKESIYDFAEEAGYKMYKPNMFLRSLFDAKNNVVYMNAKAATYSAQIVGMSIMPPKDVDAFGKALNNKYKDDLNGYKIYLLQSSYSYLDAFSKKRLRGEKAVGAYLVFIDKDVPKVLKDYLKEEKKEEEK